MSRLMRWLGFVNRSESVSAQWLKEQAASERDEFHGICISWPIQKQVDSLAWWNRTRLKRRA